METIKGIKRKPKTLFGLAYVLISWLCCWRVGGGMQELTNESNWRQTKIGWQDASTWSVSWSAEPRLIEFVHPTVVAALILLTVVGACIWASSEWQVDRLFRRTRTLTQMERTKKWVGEQEVRIEPSKTVNQTKL